MSEEQQPTTTAASKGAKDRASSAEAQRAKVNYKKTKLGWIPEEWVVLNGSEITSKITKGSSPNWQGYNYVSDGVLFVTSENVRDGYLDISTPKFVEDAFAEKVKGASLAFEDILINIVGASIGRSCLFNERTAACINQAVALFRVKKEQCPAFLQAYLQLPQTVRRLLDTQSETARPNLSLGDLRAFQFPLPSLPEQRRIAAILGTWDRAIATVQQLLAAQQKRKRGLMQKLLSGKRRFEGFEGEWRTVRLGDLGETYTGLTGKTATDFGEGAPYIPYLNVFNNSRIDPRQVDRVRIGANDRQNRVRRGDIFFTVSSETPDEVGMAAVLLDEVEEMYLNSFCFGFRLNTFDQLLPEFARYYLRGTTFRRALNKLAQGATRYNLSKGQLVNLHLHLPGIKEQQAIADCLESIDREIDALNRYTARLTAQKRGLMQQLLTGRVRVL